MEKTIDLQKNDFFLVSFIFIDFVSIFSDFIDEVIKYSDRA